MSKLRAFDASKLRAFQASKLRARGYLTGEVNLRQIKKSFRITSITGSYRLTGTGGYDQTRTLTNWTFAREGLSDFIRALYGPTTGIHHSASPIIQEGSGGGSLTENDTAGSRTWKLRSEALSPTQHCPSFATLSVNTFNRSGNVFTVTSRNQAGQEFATGPVNSRIYAPAGIALMTGVTQDPRAMAMFDSTMPDIVGAVVEAFHHIDLTFVLEIS